jgi:hypothetical protein
MLRTTILILFSLAWGLQGSAAADNLALAKRLATALEELERVGKIRTREMEVAVKDGNVTITGQISSRADAALIAAAVCQDEEVVEMHLNLAVGRPPSAPKMTEAEWLQRFTEASRQPLTWDDGNWGMRFSEPAGPKRYSQPPQATKTEPAPLPPTENPALMK